LHGSSSTAAGTPQGSAVDISLSRIPEARTLLLPRGNAAAPANRDHARQRQERREGQHRPQRERGVRVGNGDARVRPGEGRAAQRRFRRTSAAESAAASGSARRLRNHKAHT
jgi:hypothetical protein